jgi:hypothetical protein
VQVQLQLRRPSDGGVSAPRTFEFLPLDAGRAYWSAKRLKTNYNVFNQILSADQAVRSHQADAASPLRHKIRSEVMSAQLSTHAQLHSNQLADQPALLSSDEIKEEENPSSTAVSSKQLLKPVAMPGVFSLAPILQPGTAASYSRPVSTSAPNTMTDNSAAISQQPPAVPVRSPHKSSLLQTHLLLGHQQQQVPQAQLMMPQPPARQHQPPPPAVAAPPLAATPTVPRPISNISLLSDGTQFADERVSLCTQQSVNELLSLAEFELDNVSVNTFILDPLASRGERPLDSASMMAYLQQQQQLAGGIGEHH